MTTARTIIVWLVVLLLTQSEIILAQQSKPPAPETWAAVKSLSTGSAIVVKLKNGKTLKGNHVEATDDSLFLSKGKQISTINRSDVKKLHFVVERNRDISHAIGTATGAGIGLALYFSGENNETPSVSGIFLIVGIFAGVGYGLAHWFTPKYKKVLIYEANK